jgi:tRNA threonylcarbamoyladenosine dehydratase
MPHLEHILNKRTGKTVAARPQFFNFSRQKDYLAAQKLLTQNQNIAVTDDYVEQLKELFSVKNPSLVYQPNFNTSLGSYLKKLIKTKSLARQGIWVYFPWRQHLTHILAEKDFFAVRTARNKLLITQQEQEKFYNAKVGIGGLSIGSSIALALVLQGGAKLLRLADFDSLALSNTNRIRASVSDLGSAKIEITARQIYEINPYADIESFPEGLTEHNIKKFTSGLDIVVDELDQLAVKLLLRQEAQKQRIPVVMGADNGDMAVIDVERYDKNPKTKYFHGRLGKITYGQLKSLNKFQTGQAIAKLIGLENHSPRMLQSLKEMGKSIVSWPQLGGTAQLNGAALAYCIRKIATGQPLPTKRIIISFEKTFK